MTLADLLACVHCGEPVDVTRPGFYREVVGWEKTRYGGGANQIVFRRESGRLLHAGCAEQRRLRERMGIDPDQGSLLGSEGAAAGSSPQSPPADRAHLSRRSE